MTIGGGLTYIGAFVAALAILVVIHELGHYWVARAFDVKVLRFSFGFGKVMWSRTMGPDQTEWAICAVPLGGYVKMLDESEGPVDEHERQRAFNAQSLPQRALIVVAGPVANLILAVALYLVVFMHGVYEFRPVIGVPPAGTPAAMANVPSGSQLIEVNGTRVTTWQDVRWVVLHDLLDGDSLVVTLLTPDGATATYRLSAPAGLGNRPEQDSLRALGLVLEPLRIDAIAGQVVEGSAAAEAGMLQGDRIESVNGEPISDWVQFSSLIRKSPGIPLLIDVSRRDVTLRINATPRGVDDGEKIIGRLGVAPKLPLIEDDPRATLVRYGVIDGAVKALRVTVDTSVLTVRMIGRMLIGQISWKNVSGPVTMADYAGQSAQLGLNAYLRFLALISISLGVLNLLPIPVLDGGHLLYYLAEAISGKALPEYVINVAQRIGMAALGLLMFFAFYNDINRLVSG